MSLYDVARQVTDEVCGKGTYARLNAGNPDPGVQAAIRRTAMEGHDCPGVVPCYGDPNCEFALCDTCGAPNSRCVCDLIYERAHDK